MPFTNEHRKKLSIARKGKSPYKRGIRVALKGRDSWNKGLRGICTGWSKGLTKENNTSVKKVADSKLGKKRPDLIGNKFRQGKLPGNYKGGITPQNKIDRVMFKRTMHSLILERDGYKCQICDEKGDLQVDHIASWAEFKELRFDPDNCRTLCARCHYKITFNRDMPPTVKKWGHNLRILKMKGGV